MEQNRLKQRLVGATVLVALGVIFIPMFLSGDRDSGVSLLASNIPPQPAELSELEPIDLSALPKTPEPLPPHPLPPSERKALALEPPPESASAAAPPAPGGTLPAAPPKQQTAADASPPKAWVVQLASFSRESNALGLRDQLLAKNHHAFVEVVETGDAMIYRVRVGPEVRREAADKLRDRLEKETKLQGLVMAHP